MKIFDEEALLQQGNNNYVIILWNDKIYFTHIVILWSKTIERVLKFKSQ